MARPLRVEFPGAIYHITSRGNARQEIFVSKDDWMIFLSILQEVIEQYNWLCYAYCLMPNHYHLLIETLEPNLSLGMRQLNGVYTQRFNNKHNRVGHLFQGRFKSILVQRESYLLELCRYVILNPVRAKIVSHPKGWKWSSYLATIDKARKPKFLHSDWILSQFSPNRTTAIKAYNQFVLSSTLEDSPWDNLKGGIFLGDKDFIDQAKEFYKDKEDIKEIPRIERLINRPSLEVLFDKVKTKTERNQRIFFAHTRHGYLLKEIASFLGLHYSTLSKILKEFKGKG